MSNKTDEVTMIADIIRGISPKSLGVTSVHADKHGVVITEEFRGYPRAQKNAASHIWWTLNNRTNYYGTGLLRREFRVLFTTGHMATVQALWVHPDGDELFPLEFVLFFDEPVVGGEE